LIFPSQKKKQKIKKPPRHQATKKGQTSRQTAENDFSRPDYTVGIGF